MYVGGLSEDLLSFLVLHRSRQVVGSRCMQELWGWATNMVLLLGKKSRLGHFPVKQNIM